MDKTNLSQKHSAYLSGLNKVQGLNKDQNKNLSKANAEGALNPKFNKLVAEGQRELQFPGLKGGY